MTELEKRTTIVPATAFDRVFKPEAKNLDDLFNTVIKFYEFDIDKVNKLKQGAGTERLAKSHVLKMMLELIVSIIDDHKRYDNSNKIEEAIFLANKKITKDLVFSLFNLLNNYQYNDKELKIQLMGKLLQSLYGNQ